MDSDSEIFKLLGGVRTEAALADVAAGIEDVLRLPADALITSGKFGQIVSKVEDQMLQCADSNLGGLLMDGVDLGSSLSSPPPAPKRGLQSERRSLLRRELIPYVLLVPVSVKILSECCFFKYIGCFKSQDKLRRISQALCSREPSNGFP